MLTVLNWIGLRWGMNTAWRFVAVGLPLLALAVGLLSGAVVGRWPLHTELAELRTTHSESLRLAQQAAAQRVQAAQVRSDALALELGETLITNNTLSQEKTHELRLASTGRVCLSDRALGVLNGSPGLRVAGLDGVPAPQPAAAAAGKSAAADSDPASDPAAPPGTPGLVATDEDIGAWAIGAGAQYEQCRARLDALINWHTVPEAEPAHDR